jgi:hypothetical protein
MDDAAMTDTYDRPCSSCDADVGELCRPIAADLEEFGWKRSNASWGHTFMVEQSDSAPIPEWLDVPHPARIGAET